MTTRMKARISVVTITVMACVTALADDDPPNQAESQTKPEQEESEFERELLYREYPTDQRGSRFKEFWETSEDEDLRPEPEDPTLHHRNRAVSSSDYEPITSETPGANIHKVKVAKPVESDSKKEKTAPPRRNIPASLRHRDRAVKKDPVKIESTDDK